LAVSCGGGDEGPTQAELDAQKATAAAAEAAQAEAQRAADAAAADSAAAQAELEAAQQALKAAEEAAMEAQEGDADAQAALEEAQMKAEEAAQMAIDAEEAAEAARMDLEETSMVDAPQIPSSTVRLGIYPCCADHALWHIAIEKGWFEELGIMIEPENGFYFATSRDIVPAMQRGDHDIAGAWVPTVFGALETFGQEMPAILFHDIYTGYTILKAPDSNTKTALEFMAEGMSFPDAAKAAVEQLVGKSVNIPPHSANQAQYANAFYAYLDEWQDGDDWRDYTTPDYKEDTVTLQDSAVSGRIEFAFPYGAPTLIQMINNGWEPLINFAMIFDNDLISKQGRIAANTVGGSGLLANREWVEANRETVLRFLSVAFRVLDYLEDPETQVDGWTIEANLINAEQGLSLTPEEIGFIWTNIDPSFTWEDQEALWDLNLTSYHPETVFVNQVENLKAIGSLSEDFDTRAALEEFLLAQDLYYEMRGMQERSDALFARADSLDLSDSQADLVARARVFYDRFNFLDAERFLNAALAR
jgi:ABC-type nitrate/sulfonate/bicarbonate transport system substrate-binding protein